MVQQIQIKHLEELLEAPAALNSFLLREHGNVGIPRGGGAPAGSLIGRRSDL